MSIIKATRAHYAALQHRKEPGRVALDYEVKGETAGTVWVKAVGNARRKAEMTRLVNRLRKMFPFAGSVYVKYRE